MLSTIIVRQYSRRKEQMNENNIDQLMKMAQIAERAERYDDMAGYIRDALSEPRPGAKYVALTDNERTLFATAFKSVIALKRNSLRSLRYVNNSPILTGKSELTDDIQELSRTIENELRVSCLDVIAICDKIMENPELPHEDHIYYLKMKADHCRYLAEFSQGNVKKEFTEKSEQAYQEALDMAVGCGISYASPLYLGLALNFSVFYHEIKGNATKAKELANKAYDNAFEAMQNEEDMYADAYQVLPLIKDNLALWADEK